MLHITNKEFWYSDSLKSISVPLPIIPEKIERFKYGENIGIISEEVPIHILENVLGVRKRRLLETDLFFVSQEPKLMLKNIGLWLVGLFELECIKMDTPLDSLSIDESDYEKYGLLFLELTKESNLYMDLWRECGRVSSIEYRLAMNAKNKL